MRREVIMKSKKIMQRVLLMMTIMMMNHTILVYLCQEGIHLKIWIGNLMTNHTTLVYLCHKGIHLKIWIMNLMTNKLMKLIRKIIVTQVMMMKLKLCMLILLQLLWVDRARVKINM